MIFDDYIGKECVITIEGGQNIGGRDSRVVFLGVENVQGTVFLRGLHYYEQEIERNGGMIATIARDDVFIQLRKIKTLHFAITEMEAEETLAIIMDDNAGLEFKEF